VSASGPVLVTGGGGFLGRRLIELIRQEEPGREIRFLARGRYPEVEALGAVGLQVDLTAGGDLRAAVRGCDAVHHVASKAGVWGPVEAYATINVDGTAALLDACVAEGVRRFVYTSTPSVIGYAHEAEGIESAPYPDRWESPYGETKAKAEQLVLAANGRGLPGGGALATVSLRPHLLFGPRDPHLLPRVLARAREGRLMAIGDRANRVDLTFVDNAAWAQIDAERALTGPDAPCAGKAYFVSNGEPVVLWSWLDDLLRQLDLPPVTRRLPLPVATALGTLTEAAWRAFGLSGEPRMTRFLALALARSHWYSLAPATRDLGYRPRVSMAEGTARTVADLRGRSAGADGGAAP
jgi:nucleoside-diphosphate-sugar epimerase